MIGCGRAARTSWPAPAAKFDEYAYRQQRLCLILKTPPSTAGMPRKGGEA
jgi:hypothetical protein